MMDDEKFNFNLLYPFYVIYEEQNVTKAGKRLNVTQSAMSNALNQMRRQFGDQLFIRGKYGMRPTERATEIAEQLKTVLADVDNLVNESNHFNPKKTQRKFTIAITNVCSFLFIDKFIQRFYKEAPNSILNIKECKVHQYDQSYCDQHGIELLIGLRAKLPNTANHQNILDLKQVLIAKKTHAIFDGKLTLKRYLKEKHCLIDTSGYRKYNMTDEALAQKGVSRDIQVNIPYPRILPNILLSTDLIAIAPEQFLKIYKNKNLKTVAQPFKQKNIRLSQVWHNRYNADPGHKWLRSLIKTICDNV